MSSQSPFPFAARCWFLIGPTASGKTAVGIKLAERIGAEIVSLDSMALYRRMDIGTAKPTPAERAAVPHHLIDILEPHEEYSLAQYVAQAQDVVEAIESRGRRALFVGGTPLYLKGLLRGIFEGPPADWDFRHALEAEAAGRKPGWLHERLAAVDAPAAARLHPGDTRRIVRALEVHAKTGRPISQWQQQFDRPAQEARVFVLDWPRPLLHARIDARVEAMFAAGLIDEVRALLGCQVPLSRTARQAVGYREVLDHLAGRCDRATALALVQQHTRQLAKRQLTWFRSLSECRFVPVAEPLEPACVAREIAGAGEQRCS